MKAGDIVSHADYGVGRIRDIRRAGREANVEFHIGIVVVCPTSELRQLGEDAAARPPEPTSPASLHGTPPPSISRPEQTRIPATAIPRERESTPSPVPAHLREDDGNRCLSSSVPPPAAASADSNPIPPTRSSTSQYSRPEVTPDEQFQSRQVIEALRLGVVPRFKINELTIGLRRERATVEAALDRTDKYGGDVCAVVGEYGTGKSHFFEWTAQQALNRGYLVASASLDVQETPPSKPFRIYNALINSLRYPDRDYSGSLAGLFERLHAERDVNAIRQSLSVFHDSWARCPLFTAFRNYVTSRKTGDVERALLILRWISGERMPAWSMKGAHIYTGDTLRIYTTVADQYCYLLSGVAWLARQAGYKGLVVLVDESEHYSLLTNLMKGRADVFFQGMIYSALRDRQTHVPGCPKLYHGAHCGLPHGGHQPYPFSYSPESGLLFMFAATTSEVALDYASWLDPDKVIRLESRLSPGEIEELLARIYVHHRKAFGYDRKADFADTSSELITLYETGRFNLREMIRVSTEAYDLIYTYPGYSPRLED